MRSPAPRVVLFLGSGSQSRCSGQMCAAGVSRAPSPPFFPPPPLFGPVGTPPDPPLGRLPPTHATDDPAAHAARCHRPRCTLPTPTLRAANDHAPSCQRPRCTLPTTTLSCQSVRPACPVRCFARPWFCCVCIPARSVQKVCWTAEHDLHVEVVQWGTGVLTVCRSPLLLPCLCARCFGFCVHWHRPARPHNDHAANDHTANNNDAEDQTVDNDASNSSALQVGLKRTSCTFRALFSYFVVSMFARSAQRGR